MQIRTPRAVVAAAALALFASACTDTPTNTPSARAPGERALLTRSGSGPALVSNSVKYRDQGAKPARGRAGSAALEVTALQAKNGSTRLALTATHAEHSWWYGEITRARVKAYSTDGRHKFTRALSDADEGFSEPGQVGAAVRLPGLVGGDRVEVQAQVRGVDAHRTGVVTVTETVKRLPDLRVRLSAPAQAAASTWTNIMATVTEHNGDVGAYAVCELFVGGESVDFADGMWIDAGDAVTCALTWNFPVPGTYPIEVRVRMLNGDEWEPADNVDTASIQVLGARPGFHTLASYSQGTTVDSSTARYAWRDTQTGRSGEDFAERYEASSNQFAYADGVMPLHITEPVDLRVSMSTGGQVVHAAEWTRLGADTPWGWCTDLWDGRTMFWLCTGGGAIQGSTTFTYYLSATSVTYHSRGYSKVWDELAGTEDVYHWNESSGWDQTVPVGDDWTFSINLRTASAEYDGSRSLALVRSTQEHVFPEACDTWEDGDYVYTTCSSWTSRTESITGE